MPCSRRQSVVATTVSSAPKLSQKRRAVDRPSRCRAVAAVGRPHAKKSTESRAVSARFSLAPAKSAALCREPLRACRRFPSLRYDPPRPVVAAFPDPTSRSCPQGKTPRQALPNKRLHVIPPYDSAIPDPRTEKGVVVSTEPADSDGNENQRRIALTAK